MLCPPGVTGILSGGFAPGDKVVFINPSAPLTINFNSPVQTVGAQIQDNSIGDHFTAEILAFNGSTFLGAFTENGFSGDVGDNSHIFLGVQAADITSVTYLTFTGNPFTLQDVLINQMTIRPAAVPGPTIGAGRARRRPLRRGQSVRLPALLRIKLRQPAGEPAKSIHQALAKD
jgi:hypothetical protein